MKNFKDEILLQFQTIFKDVISTLPQLIKFIVFFIMSWLIIKVTLWLVRKILKKSNVDLFSDKLSQSKILSERSIRIKFSKVIPTILRWFLILIFVLAGSNIFGLETLSEGIKAFFAYLPKLVTALVIFFAGIYLGTLVKKSIVNIFKSMDLNGGNVIGSILLYLIAIFTSITALDLAGIDTSIIKQNITLILGALLLSFTIAFGFGAKEAITRLLFGYYSRKNIQIGSRVIINGVEGIVTAIDNICVLVVKDNGEKEVFPIKTVVDSQVSILK